VISFNEGVFELSHGDSRARYQDRI